jgi:hypothetical protein
MGDFPICHYSKNATNACTVLLKCVARSFRVHQAASIPASLKRRRSLWDHMITNRRATKSLAEKIPDISFSQIGHLSDSNSAELQSNIYTVDYDANPNL